MNIVDYTQDPDKRNSFVTLPIAREDLVDFVSNLLGQPQSIERVYYEKYDINHEWLMNIHECIHQKITQQTEAALINFTATIYFSDQTKRTLNSLESFAFYNETLGKLQIGVKIAWEYLVKFPNKSSPEKQQISFRALIHNKEPAKKTNSIEKLANINFLMDDEESTILVQIDHTERTWGDEILYIFETQIAGIIRSNATKDLFINLCRILLCGGFFISTIIFGFYRLIYDTQVASDDLLSKIKQISDSSVDLSLINEKIDLMSVMLNALAHRDSGVGPFFIIMMLGGGITIIMNFLTQKRTFSFVNLSSASSKYRDRKLKIERRAITSLIISGIVAIALSVTANYIYSWLT